MEIPLALGLVPRYASPSFQMCTPFSGLVDDFTEDFFRKYEEFPNSCKLTDCPKGRDGHSLTTPDLRDFWKSLDDYVASGWRDLKCELVKLFEGPSVLRPHSE